MPHHRRQVSDVVLNRNVQWLNHPAPWAVYFGLVLVSWLLFSVVTSDSGMAWTWVHLTHGVMSYYILHWMKGTPFEEDQDQGKYDGLTFWEQIDNGIYATRNRTLFALVPVVTYMLATHGTDFRRQPLGANTVVVVWLTIAKLPFLHKVRFFGINKY